jgi:outer membrane protein assembly factor BamE (lipoprotein component of BamABCDE complex)
LDYYYWPLNFYLAERSRVQLHIACDKLASSLLSYYGKRKHGMGRIVNYNYMQVATLPTLYYSALSGAIAAMSAFGACSLRHENLEDQEQMNIIRSTMGFVLVKRSAYLQQTCNKNGRWHDQIWILYNHLINQGYELNIISLDTVRALKRHRELFDYRLLGQPSLSKGYGSDTYFNLVPKVLDSLDSCESIVASILPVEEQREISPRIAAMRKLYSELK